MRQPPCQFHQASFAWWRSRSKARRTLPFPRALERSHRKDRALHEGDRAVPTAKHSSRTSGSRCGWQKSFALQLFSTSGSRSTMARNAGELAIIKKGRPPRAWTRRSRSPGMPSAFLPQSREDCRSILACSAVRSRVMPSGVLAVANKQRDHWLRPERCTVTLLQKYRR